MSDKITCENWIIRAQLSDGRTVNLDVDDQAAGEVDSFITKIEEKQEWDEWITDEI